MRFLKFRSSLDKKRSQRSSSKCKNETAILPCLVRSGRNSTLQPLQSTTAIPDISGDVVTPSHKSLVENTLRSFNASDGPHPQSRPAIPSTPDQEDSQIIIPDNHNVVNSPNAPPICSPNLSQQKSAPTTAETYTGDEGMPSSYPSPVPDFSAQLVYPKIFTEYDDSFLGPGGSTIRGASKYYRNEKTLNKSLKRLDMQSVVLQMAEDMAYQEAQYSIRSQEHEEREKALKKMLLECGVPANVIDRRLLETRTRPRRLVSDSRVSSYNLDTDSGSAPEREGTPTLVEEMLAEAMSEVAVTGDPRSSRSISNAPSRSVRDDKSRKRHSMPCWPSQVDHFQSPIYSSVSSSLSSSSSSLQTERLPYNSSITESDDSFHGSLTTSKKGFPVLTASRGDIFPSSIRAVPDRRTSLPSQTLSSSIFSPGNTRSSDLSSLMETEASTSLSAATLPWEGNGPADRLWHFPASMVKTANQTIASSDWIPQMIRDHVLHQEGLHANSGSHQKSLAPVELRPMIPEASKPPPLAHCRGSVPELKISAGRAADKYAFSSQDLAPPSETYLGDGGCGDPSSNDNQDPALLVDRPPTRRVLTDRFGFMYEPREREEESSYVPYGSGDEETIHAVGPSESSQFGLNDLRVVSGTHSVSGKRKRQSWIMSNESNSNDMRSMNPSLAISTTAAVPESIKTGTGNETSQEVMGLLLSRLAHIHDSLQKEQIARWDEFFRQVYSSNHRSNTEIDHGHLLGIFGGGFLTQGRYQKKNVRMWNKFRQLVMSGVPVIYRAKVWSECSGAINLKEPGVYDDLCMRDADPDVVGQIDLDMHRTMPSNIFFAGTGQGVSMLRRLLIAFCNRDSNIGYCQGMNTIGATLLLTHETEEDAFWTFVSLVENILPQGYFAINLITSRADQEVFVEKFKELIPDLYNFLTQELCVNIQAITFDWFLGCFSHCLNAELVFRIWDVLLCLEGEIFLFKVALALFKLLENDLYQMKSGSEVYKFMKNLNTTCSGLNIEHIIDYTQTLKDSITYQDIRRLREIEIGKLGGF